MKKGLKVFLIILSIIVALIIIGAIAISRFASKAGKGLEALNSTAVEDIDLALIPDGTFSGSYEAFPVSVEVEVTVQGGSITEIDLIKHVNGKGQAAEAIPDMVVEAQSLQVDVISGATYSSKVILLAIENALKSAAGD